MSTNEDFNALIEKVMQDKKFSYIPIVMPSPLATVPTHFSLKLLTHLRCLKTRADSITPGCALRAYLGL
jgi:hypothetical protein